MSSELYFQVAKQVANKKRNVLQLLLSVVKRVFIFEREREGGEDFGPTNTKTRRSFYSIQAEICRNQKITILYF